MRDTQRSRLYDWERALDMDDTPMPLPEVVRFVNQVCHDYGRRTIEVRDGRRRRRGVAWGSSTISLPRMARSRWYVLHEVAHCLSASDPAHGPEYARLLAELYHRYCGVSMAALRAKATEHRVRWARSTKVRKPISREERKLKDAVHAARVAYDAASVALSEYRRVHGNGR
jgi:hypothetical protein